MKPSSTIGTMDPRAIQSNASFRREPAPAIFLSTTTLTLPYPPSVNSYWGTAIRKGKVVHFLSKRAKAFREAVITQCLLDDAPRMMQGNLALSVTLQPPDHKMRDIDNGLKALLDALQHAHVFANDNQVRRLAVEMIEPLPPGKCIVTIGNTSAAQCSHSQQSMFL